MLTLCKRFLSVRNKYSTLSVPLLLSLLFIVAGVLFYSAARFNAQRELTRIATSDMMFWSVVQVEVDYKNLMLALLKLQKDLAAPSPVGASLETALKTDVQVAFDVFFSRVDIVASVPKMTNVPIEDAARIAVLVAETKKLAVTLDAMIVADRLFWRAFSKSVDALGPLVRLNALDALSRATKIAKNNRLQDNTLWSRVLAANSALLAVMVVAILIALHLRRQMSLQFLNLQNASYNTQMVYEASTLAILVISRSGDVLLFNAAAETLFGHSAAQMHGRNIADTLVPKRLLSAYLKWMQNLRQTGPKDRIERFAIRTFGLSAAGNEVPIEVSARITRDANGQQTVVAFVRDMSEQVANEANLRLARDEARHHAAAKSRFLATMSHEMRTPLHGLLASLDLIDDKDVGINVRNLLRGARDCGLRSLQQVDDVLLVAQMSEVQEPLASVDPSKVVNAIFEELHALACENGNQLQLSVVGASSVQRWLGMPKTLMRVMYNLIGNAIKYTQNGNVNITLKFEMTATETTSLYVFVEDTGIGISADDCKSVFDPFFTSFRADIALRPDNTGLGLSIAKLGVEKMGGTLNVTSQLGVGSRFFFEIPILALPSDTANTLEPDVFSAGDKFDLVCMVVDDNLLNLKLTAQMLRNLGCKTLEASCGAGAICHADANAFDVIFMDVNMPGGLSGAEATGIIRASGRSQSALIVALTADTMFQGKAMLVANQMDRVLHKPVNQNDLAMILSFVGLLQRTKGGVSAIVAGSHEIIETRHTDFEEVFTLLGREKAERLLVGVLQDIDDAVSAIGTPGVKTADALHRAIGSVAAVGLSQLSQVLRQAENHQRTTIKTRGAPLTPDFIYTLKDNAGDARARIKRALLQK